MDESVDAAIEALARRHHGAFSRLRAFELGASPDQIKRRLQNGRWTRAGHGVYVLRGWPDTYKQRVMVATLHAGQGSFASHECAALLRALDGVTSAPVEIAVPRRLRAKPHGVKVHYSTDATTFDWTIVDGIPTATVTQIIVDLAGDPSVTLQTLERIFECGQRRRETSHEQVREAFERLARKGKPGVTRGRELVGTLVDDGEVNHSELETRFYQLLRDAGLPLPRRQRVMYRPDGRFAFADYAYDEVDGIIELLGVKWHSSSAAVTAGAERSNDLVLQRKIILQFTWQHVTSRKAYVVRKVTELLCMGPNAHPAMRPSHAQERPA